VVLQGSKGEKIKFVYDDNARKYEVAKPFEGVLPNLERRWRETDSSAGSARSWAATSPTRPARSATASA
jgi:excinuclease UvrABC ATPase subunit